MSMLHVLILTKNARRAGVLCRLLAEHDPPPTVVLVPIEHLEMTRDQPWDIVFADARLPLPAEFDAGDAVTVWNSASAAADVQEAFGRAVSHARKPHP